MTRTDERIAQLKKQIAAIDARLGELITVGGETPEELRALRSRRRRCVIGLRAITRGPTR